MELALRSEIRLALSDDPPKHLWRSKHTSHLSHPQQLIGLACNYLNSLNYFTYLFECDWHAVYVSDIAGELRLTQVISDCADMSYMNNG